eukprot:6451073-Pyramimonas_sp.AAC.1
MTTYDNDHDHDYDDDDWAKGATGHDRSEGGRWGDYGGRGGGGGAGRDEGQLVTPGGMEPGACCPAPD